ncbi:hypothetical protein FSP39_014489 [Pinctada imbricata]|uniref:Paladin n=1 Tax=Pinctada imbricata TaxID=66713 RepID=A0AA88Y139_PINIB|nr:hypothetical protein FSP39_014489 [Pinctada imbricata]
MPEHPLVKGRYFIVRDMTEKHDQKKTYTQYKAPNFHRVQKGMPVFGAGQPTESGLTTLIDVLSEEGYSDILVFNLREEPVLFVDTGTDKIPYTIRDQDNMGEPVILGRNPYEADEAEARIRKEVIDLATIQEENKFYFYKDLDNLQREPHEVPIQFEDNLLVSEEVYAHHVLCTHSIWYQRLCFPLESAPCSSDVDCFINLFKDVPMLFDKSRSRNLGLLMTCDTGMGRTTLGMAMGTLVLAHRNGFNSFMSKGGHKIKIQCEFQSVQKLVALLPAGNIIKCQVDTVIDMCADLCNLRSEIKETKKLLENTDKEKHSENKAIKEELYQRCSNYLERYIFLICFNAYLTEQFPLRLTKSYSKWIQQHPNLIRILGNVHQPNTNAPTNLVLTGEQYLVADDYISLDVLSSQMDVRVSNFRRIKGFHIYGMAQPNRDGANKVSNHLLSKKLGHNFLVLINLRNDVAVECDGQTYSIRDATCLDEPVIHPGTSKEELEVYNEITSPSESREFSSILTPSELADNQKLQTLDMEYVRLPLQYDTRPTEQDFDNLMSLICDHWLKNEKSNKSLAFVYYCRTGKSRTTFAMATTGLVLCHIKGFPFGAGMGEAERVSCPNAQYTKGDFMIVQKLIRLLPNGHQVKREVDFILDECFETMSPMHFHIREVIFVTYNKALKAKTEEEKHELKRQSIDALERYIYLILFNMYLHHDKNIKWQRPFSTWMSEVAAKAGVYQLMDSLAFYDFEKVPTMFKTMQERWRHRYQPIPFYGMFL